MGDFGQRSRKRRDYAMRGIVPLPALAATTRSPRTGWSSPETITTLPWTTGVTVTRTRP